MPKYSPRGPITRAPKMNSSTVDCLLPLNIFEGNKQLHTFEWTKQFHSFEGNNLFVCAPVVPHPSNFGKKSAVAQKLMLAH